ncbi:MerR family transcriptional regulator [Gulosibacter sp. 10]|uniref:MerR family transcriptional regulator n=1 Tax=Gulosibacter sp. 10 TaxID=1255570 RepID=UPI000B357FBC|nr:MerR family transcriptional regulator [Gulosibacter sp. 10]
MDWSIQEIAKLAGTTSRTLRHYDAIGLLEPTRIGGNGYRRYDEEALVRLQRILLLRELGLGLPQIAEVLDRQSDPVEALESHLEWLREERDRLGRQIASVRSTIEVLQEGGVLMATTMFDGFDHTRYREEVEQRWGADAYAEGDRWWRSLSEAERADWQRRVADLANDWSSAAERGVDPASEEAQALAHRHVEWLRGVPGTPAAAPDGDIAGYVRGLADMYVADPRFGANYATSEGGAAGAEFVRDALHRYAEERL